MKDAERRCRRRTIWRECFPKFLRGEVARHMAHQRTAADIAVRLGGDPKWAPFIRPA